MTNYQSTSYHVQDHLGSEAAFAVIPPLGVDVGDPEAYPVLTLKLGSHLGSGEANLNSDDVRGLQAFLNDQFGRGVARLPESVADTVKTAINNLLVQGYRVLAPDGSNVGAEHIPEKIDQLLPRDGAPSDPGWGTAPDGAATWNPIEAQRAAAVLPGTDVQAEQFLQAMESAGDAIQQMQQPRTALDYYPEYDGGDPQTWTPQVGDKVNVYPAQMEPQGQDGYVVVPTSNPAEQNVTVAQQQPAPRQCPVTYNGVQCSKPDWHVNSQLGGTTAEHTFFTDAPQNEHAPLAPPPFQTGDGATTPPAAPLAKTGATVGEQAAESAPVAPATEAPSPSAEPLSADLTKPKKTVNRRKKEEKAYDDALDAFRAQPTSQLEYVALTNAAEALRKRFPDAARLENWDAHIRLQNVQVLLGDNPAPHQETASAPVQPEPHFAPEPSAPAQPTPFIPPAPAEPSAEELQAGQAFPCQHVSTQSGWQCTRPAGHELANPPKPHFYPPLEDGQSVPVPSFTQEPMSTGVPGFTVTPVNEGNGFTQATVPPFQIPQPQGGPSAAEWAGTPTSAQPAPALSFQVPPTPEGADLQPPAPAAPAAPPWSAS